MKVICKFSIATFTDGEGGDRVHAMAENVTPFPGSHPLLEDRARLEKIKNNMHVQIQWVLHGRRIRDDVEVALPGGASVDDVLQDALLALLRTNSAKVRTSWETLSSEIARNKAKDALSRATRGRRSPKAEPGTPDDVTLVSLDERIDAADTDPANDPVEAFDLAQQQLVILRLARETLRSSCPTAEFSPSDAWSTPAAKRTSRRRSEATPSTPQSSTPCSPRPLGRLLSSSPEPRLCQAAPSMTKR